MASAENIQLGSCSVTFNGVDLGYTKGGVDIEIKTDTQKFTVDYFNRTVVREYVVNRTATVTIPMSETTYDNFKLMFAGSNYYDDGSTEKVNIITATGELLNDYSATLVLHPTGVDPADKSLDVTFPTCYPLGNTSFSFKPNEERIYEVEFNVIHNSTTGVLFVVGDPATAEGSGGSSTGQYDFSSTNNGVLVTTL